VVKHQHCSELRSSEIIEFFVAEVTALTRFRVGETPALKYAAPLAAAQTAAQTNQHTHQQTCSHL
jgi:hypothetical protein